MAELPSIEELIGTTSQRLTPFRDYRMLRGHGESAYLSLFAPPSGQVLVTAATRVNHFAELTDDLPTLGLPTRMKDCLIYYACWQLLSQRLPVGQEDLKLTSRQTEAGSEDTSEILDGDQLSTQLDAKSQVLAGTKGSTTTEARDQTVTTDEDGTTTEDKTPTITGTRESTTTEIKAASESEDTSLEQNEHKDESVYSSSSESTSSRSSGTEHEDMDETTIEAGLREKHAATSDDQLVVSDATRTVVPDLTDKTVPALKSKTVGSVTPSGNAITSPDEHTDATWDHATPPKQTGSHTYGSTVVDDNRKESTDMTETETGKNTVTHKGKETTRDAGSEATTNVEIVNEQELQNTESTTEGEKDTERTEQSSGSTSGARSDSTSGLNMLLNTQAKAATANEDNVTLFTETTTQGTAEDNLSIIDKTTIEVTDEDKSTVVAETTGETVTENNTVTVNQATDNTTTTGVTSAKTTGIEAMATFRDRMQTAQYYKLLLDMEVQSKKMRSWAARGL